MADAEDKERAEKLAAARKKAQKALKQKKAGQKATKSKEENKEGEGDTATDSPAPAESSDAPAPQDDTAKEAPSGDVEASEQPKDDHKPTKSQHGRQMSVSAQSKLRSESFRNNPGPISPTILSPTGDRPEDLERDDQRPATEVQEAKARLERLEEELVELRAAQGSNAQKAQQAEDANRELEKLKSEVAALQRQNTQLNNTVAQRKSSSSAPTDDHVEDLRAQLSSKSSTIESLEVELSRLNTKLVSAQSSSDTQTSRISELESKLEKAEKSAASAAQELADLKANLAKTSEDAEKEGNSRTNAETRLAQLSAELGTAKRSSEEAVTRSETLEKKIEALNSLHREAESRSQAKITELQKGEREGKELRARLNAMIDENDRLKMEISKRHRAAADGDDAGLDELEDEERRRIQRRVRELEEENYDLRRGVWRDKRRAMQPGMDEHNGFDEVELSPATGQGSWSPGQRPQPQQHSSFADVINSGISAFTGADNRRRLSSAAAKHVPRKQSIGLMSEDGFEFDEDAFRQAQENEAKNRLERIKELKRGMGQWKGWRVDLVEMRSPIGGVFEV